MVVQHVRAAATASGILGGRVIAAVHLSIEGGGVIHALVIETGGVRRAIYWDRAVSAFATIQHAALDAFAE